MKTLMRAVSAFLLLTVSAQASFSQPIFQLRPQSLTPYYSTGSSLYGLWASSGSVPAIVTDTNAGSGWGNQAIDYSGTNGRYLNYVGFNNMPAALNSTGMCWLARIDPGWTGSPATTQGIYYAGNYHEKFDQGVTITTAAKIHWEIIDNVGGVNVNTTTTAAASFTSGTATDLMGCYTGGTTNALTFYQDGTLIETDTATASTSSTYTNAMQPMIDMGAQGAPINGGSTTVSYKLIEFDLFNSVQSAYSPRSGPVSTSNLNGDTVPTAGNTKTGVITGLNTGTLTCTDPGIANVVNSTSYEIYSVSYTGTYTTPSCTDPGVSNVLLGTTYSISGTSKTGTRDDAQNATVLTGVVYGAGTQTGSMTCPSGPRVIPWL